MITNENSPFWAKDLKESVAGTAYEKKKMNEIAFKAKKCNECPRNEWKAEVLVENEVGVAAVQYVCIPVTSEIKAGPTVLNLPSLAAPRDVDAIRQLESRSTMQQRRPF